MRMTCDCDGRREVSCVRAAHRRFSSAAGCCLLLATVAACAPRNSPQVLAELERITAQPDSESVDAGIHSGLLSFVDFVHLAEDVTGPGHEVVSGAYVGAESERLRKWVITLAAYRNSARYVPLMCYAAQFDSSPDVRLAAAHGLAQVRDMEPPLSRSVVVEILGEQMSDAEESWRQARYAYYLERFLRKTCDFAIPGAEPRPRPLPLDASGRVTLEVTRSEPSTVLAWWEATGRHMAAAREFDQPQESTGERALQPTSAK